MVNDTIEISQVPNEISSQEELHLNFDSIKAYHGTSHRFKDAILEHGLDPEIPFQMEEEVTDKSLVFFGPANDQDMNPPHSEVHGANRYANNTVRKTVGGKAMIVECELPIEKLERDDIAKVDIRDVENLYQSIVNYGVAAHRGRVEPKHIENTFTTHSSPKPPVGAESYVNTDEFNEWMDAALKGEEPNIEKLKEIGENYKSQIDPREYIDEEPVTAEELYNVIYQKE